jgi:hypothetical protein
MSEELKNPFRENQERRIAAEAEKSEIQREEAMLSLLQKHSDNADADRQNEASHEKVERQSWLKQRAIAKAQLKTAQRLNSVTCLSALFAFLSFMGVAVSIWFSRNATIESQRAWVFLKTFDANPVTDKSGAVVAWEINPRFENSGSTPTKNLITYVDVAFNKIDPTTFPPDLHPERIGRGTLIGPKTTSAVTGAIALNGALKSAAQGKLFVWGWVEYNDVFEHTPCHRMRFVNNVVVLGDLTKVPPPANPVLRFPSFPAFNESDDNCTH